MEYFKNKLYHLKEQAFRTELDKLKAQENQMKKSRGLKNTYIINDINELISQYAEKLKNTKEKTKQLDEGRYEDVIKSYNAQILDQKIAESHHLERINKLDKQENNLALEKLKARAIGNDDKSIDKKKNATKDEKNKTLQLRELMEVVNSILHEKKNKTLNEQYLLQDIKSRFHEKQVKIEQEIKIFTDVQKRAEKEMKVEIEKQEIIDVEKAMKVIDEKNKVLVVSLKLLK
jgi:hypothetical protein